MPTGRSGPTIPTRPSRTSTTGTKARARDYPSPDGGYLDNGSTGYTPRFWEEMVRQLFVSSAAAFIEEFHVDGLRVDLTQAMHRDNVRHADGRSVGSANQFGAKTLREWSRTLRLIKPTAMLIAEDHSEWDKVTQLPEAGGLGFDATWYAAFYHNLIGDSDMAGGRARLLKSAGFGDDRPLDMGQFASVLYGSKYDKVVYHESHDEAGNSGGSMRTLPCAVNGAALVGPTRAYAEGAVARRVRPVAVLGGHADVLHGRGSRRAKALPVRHLHGQPRGHRRRARGQWRQAVSLLPGRHPLQPAASGGARRGASTSST